MQGCKIRGLEVEEEERKRVIALVFAGLLNPRPQSARFGHIPAEHFCRSQVKGVTHSAERIGSSIAGAVGKDPMCSTV